MSAALTERSVEILRDLIAFPTISTDSNLAMIDYLAERLGALGARVIITRDETGEKANVFATLGPDVKGGVLLSGHSDVVPVTDQDWTTDPFALTEADGLLYGRGTCDMKGFLAVCIAMVPRMLEVPLARPIHIAIFWGFLVLLVNTLMLWGRAFDPHFHAFRLFQQQGLRGENMFHLARPDAECQCAKRAVGRGMAVTTHDGLAGLREPSLRSDDVDDPVSAVAERVARDAELGAIALEHAELHLRLLVDDLEGLRVRWRRVVHRRDRLVGAANFEPALPQAGERLG